MHLSLAEQRGVFVDAAPTDVGGVTTGNIGYIFVSDTDSLTSQGKSVHSDASTSELSFSNDFVTDTGSSGDPLVGAEVNRPTLVCRGVAPDGGIVFNPLDAVYASEIAFGWIDVVPSSGRSRISRTLFSKSPALKGF